MNSQAFCICCRSRTCPTLSSRFAACPKARLDALTAEYLDLVTDPKKAPQLASALASLAFNVEALRRK